MKYLVKIYTTFKDDPIITYLERAELFDLVENYKSFLMTLDVDEEQEYTEGVRVQVLTNPGKPNKYITFAVRTIRYIEDEEYDAASIS